MTMRHRRYRDPAGGDGHLATTSFARFWTTRRVIRAPPIGATVDVPIQRSDMTRHRPLTFLASAAAIPLVALAVAACGGGGSAATAATPKTSTGASATVGVSKSSLGSILVNSRGP